MKKPRKKTKKKVKKTAKREMRKFTGLPIEWWKRLNEISPGSMKGLKNRALQIRWLIEAMEVHIAEEYRPKRIQASQLKALRKKKK